MYTVLLIYNGQLHHPFMVCTYHIIKVKLFASKVKNYHTV